MSNILDCTGIVAEIGPGNYYSIKSLTINKNLGSSGSKADLTIDLDIGQALPHAPALVAIIPSNRNNPTYFNGLYLNENLTFVDNVTRQYGVSLVDLFPLTRLKQIPKYKAKAILETHVIALMMAANVYHPLAGLNTFEKPVMVLDTTTDLGGGNEFNPRGTLIDFKFDGGFLDAALTKLAGETGCSWYVESNHWRVSNLAAINTGAGLGKIVFRQNSVGADDAPKKTIYAATGPGMICEDTSWIESMSISNSFPLVTKVTQLGINSDPTIKQNPVSEVVGGKIITSSTFSRSETLPRDIPKQSTLTKYFFPETVTSILAGKIITNDP